MCPNPAMRIRRIAILIDGGFFLKRLPKIVEKKHWESPEAVAESARVLCKRHVQHLIRESEKATSSKWLDHVYRLFYYDAKPFAEIAHHPLLNQQIQFAKTREARFREELFNRLRRKRKFALRLGKVTKEDSWRIKNAALTKKILKTRQFSEFFEQIAAANTNGEDPPRLDGSQLREFEAMTEAWRNLTPNDVTLALRQKGVDMRIGTDIATIALKNQADTIILVTGDSDFVPAAKVARREGVEFLIDPLWQSINDDLHEHVDGVVAGFKRSAEGKTILGPNNEEDAG